jgi:hypothetical protein
MIDDSFTPQEQALIERLRNAPQRRLDAAKVNTIEAKMLSAVDMPIPAARPPILATRTFPILIAVAAIIVFIILVVNSQRRQQQAATAEASISAETGTLTQTSIPATLTSVPLVATDSQPATVPQTMSPTMPQTPLPTSASASPPDTAIVVEGPVRAIEGNRITVYDLTFQTAADDPMLNIIKVGDVVRLKGSRDKTGLIVAVQISNTSGASAGGGTALVDGRVEMIDRNVLTINGIKVQLPPDDPRLKAIRPGNFLSVNGNFERQGTTVVLIVVNLVIVNDNDVDLYLACRKSKAMGMSMGMGKDGMGMGSANCP